MHFIVLKFVNQNNMNLLKKKKIFKGNCVCLLTCLIDKHFFACIRTLFALVKY